MSEPTKTQAPSEAPIGGSTKPSWGVLLVQLGTPDDATPESIKQFLKEFLSDQHVVDTNPLLWSFILNFIILPTRSEKVAGLYQRLFTNYGPVLLTYTKSLAVKLNFYLAKNQNLTAPVSFGMRYGNPGFKQALLDLISKQQAKHVLVVPLFPQFSISTTGSIKDAVTVLKKELPPEVVIDVLDNYHDHPLYIDSIARHINTILKQRATAPDRIMLSYHGIPLRYVQTKGDPYSQQCRTTTELITKNINYPTSKILHTYQSRFGKEEWLKPYTDKTLIELAQSGVKDVLIACPGFASDCLETLDEITIEAQKIFCANGGQRLQLVSCLNDDEIWVTNLAKIIASHIPNLRNS